MKNNKSLLVFLLTVIFQFSGIILAIVLENLSSKKMGVARYLIFKKQEFAATFFTPLLMNIYILIFTLGAVVCFVLLVIHRNRRERNISFLMAVIANSSGIIFIRIQPEMQAYHFFLIGNFIVIIVQYIRILFGSYRTFIN